MKTTKTQKLTPAQIRARDIPTTDLLAGLGYSHHSVTPNAHDIVRECDGTVVFTGSAHSVSHWLGLCTCDDHWGDETDTPERREARAALEDHNA